MKTARDLRVSGVVQGVGFRPFVYRIAREHGVAGWVLNAESGVVIHAEAPADALERFTAAIRDRPPPAARVAEIDVQPAVPQGFEAFEIRQSEKRERPSVRVSPDLPVCDRCLSEMRDPADRRYGYPYINCTNCGPRYSIVLSLPYDRPNTTMRDWPMCAQCSSEYHDPADRRFHAQPIACAACGPTYVLGGLRGTASIEQAAALLREGAIVAVKGLGGYHLGCDARNARAVTAMRERKFRKERPFALMTASLAQAHALADLDDGAVQLLTAIERPIVLAPAKELLEGIAPGNRELGIMLPYTPVQHLLFEHGAPDVLVMTSANRSSEPIAYEDADALARLHGIADAFLLGERQIARRVDDSVARSARSGTAVMRHARGYAPRYVATIPAARPILATGADLKNAVALVVNGQALVGQHIGDLEHFPAFDSFRQTIADLCAMYEVGESGLVVAHDAHPHYASTQYAKAMPGTHVPVQHHRAHIASVLAERDAWDAQVTGFALDGTGYGDDGAIWGFEIFGGSLRTGLERIIHLRAAALPGGDAAARHPVQCAAGFLAQLSDLPDFEAAPFHFPKRYRQARQLLETHVRCFSTTSAGRLFDAVAALCGFTREITFEGQAAMWLEHLALTAKSSPHYRLPLENDELDFRPLLQAVVSDRARGVDPARIALGFHACLAQALCDIADRFASRPAVASGGVFQNRLLSDLMEQRLGTQLWLNANVPCNDGGICLGQAALASVSV